MSKEVNLVRGRLKSQYEMALALDQKVVEYGKEVFELQKKIAERKKAGATKEDLKGLLSEAVDLNTRRGLMEQNLHVVMAAISELKFLADMLKLDLKQDLNEDGMRVLGNIVEATKLLYALDEGEVVAVDESFLNELLKESLERATSPEGLQRNFDSVIVE